MVILKLEELAGGAIGIFSNERFSSE